MLSQLKLLLSSIKSLLIVLLLDFELFKLGLHFKFFTLNAFFLFLLLPLGLFFLLLELSVIPFHELHILVLLLFEDLLLRLIAFFCDALLFGLFSELHFVKSHVPVDLLIVLVLLLPGVVSHSQRLRVIRLDAIEALLLDQLPSELKLVSLCHLVS